MGEVKVFDLGTGKEQKIVIRASSGLSEDEIKRMVTDAEAHAAEDKKFRELVETRNRADALVHATEKSLQELGDKVAAADRASVESALSDLRTTLKGDDKEVIDRKAEALAKAASGLAAQAQQANSPGGHAAGGDAGAADAGAAPNDNVVDAEFEEVKDKNRGNT
jgi:molecular chaperone DnaK